MDLALGQPQETSKEDTSEEDKVDEKLWYRYRRLHHPWGMFHLNFANWFNEYMGEFLEDIMEDESTGLESTFFVSPHFHGRRHGKRNLTDKEIKTTFKQ
ncbi:unnamed protein product [marine sediment metagenome]|uniref:Uncharacterized protein n=1 Tax=marine sediment metagenome TaxID=412755 RepID=X1VKE5_9ZZZZ